MRWEGGRGKRNKTFAALEELHVEEWLITEGSPRRPGQPAATALGPRFPDRTLVNQTQESKHRQGIILLVFIWKYAFTGSQDTNESGM